MISALQRYGIFGWHCKVSAEEIHFAGLLIEDTDQYPPGPVELFDVSLLPERVPYTVILPEKISNKNYAICLQRQKLS